MASECECPRCSERRLAKQQLLREYNPSIPFRSLATFGFGERKGFAIVFLDGSTAWWRSGEKGNVTSDFDEACRAANRWATEGT